MASDPTVEMEESPRTVRVAVVQAAPVLFDTRKSLQKLADLTANAVKQGAELVVFPEAYIAGYPKGHDYGVSVGLRSPEGRNDFGRYMESAIEVPGASTEAIGKVARYHAVHLVVGVVERDGGTLYCTALVFGPDGTLLGTHRKLMPTAMERVLWGSGDGSTLPVVPTNLGRIGMVICWENYMPLLRMAMYAKRVELYCAITVDDRDTWLSTVTHIAVEGRCFVLSACQFLQRVDLPPDYPTGRFPVGQDVLIRGGSCIIGPLGQLLAGPKYGEECILTADLDRADLARAKFDFDVVGHYSRPDVFRLTVNEAATRPVTFTSAPAAQSHGPAAPPLTLLGVAGRFAVCKLLPGSAIPAWATAGDVFSVTRTGDELSVVCRQDVVPAGTHAEIGWRCLRVAGAMPFTLVGVLASLTRPVAAAGVGVFAISTFDTDYLFVKEAELPAAVAALRGAGHLVEGAAVTADEVVRLRPVQPGDLPRMYDLQLDPESNRMAVTIHRTREAFGSHWAKVLDDPAITARAILVGEALVGVVSCFPRDGQDHVGYWIDRAHWGRGIASRALHLLLREVLKRPLVATAATRNGASLRVLQKCGFVIEQVRLSPADERHPECEEAVLVLR
jgi:nitrilase